MLLLLLVVLFGSVLVVGGSYGYCWCFGGGSVVTIGIVGGCAAWVMACVFMYGRG